MQLTFTHFSLFEIHFRETYLVRIIYSGGDRNQTSLKVTLQKANMEMNTLSDAKVTFYETFLDFKTRFWTKIHSWWYMHVVIRQESPQRRLFTFPTFFTQRSPQFSRLQFHPRVRTPPISGYYQC